MDSFSRYPVRLILLFAALICSYAGQVHAVPIGSTPLSIGNYTLVSSQRVSRFEFDYTYAAQATNSGADVFNLNASLSSNSPAMTVIEGALNFGDVGGGMTAASSDTFVVRHNRLAGALDASAFAWDVSFDTGAPGVPVSASLILSNDLVPTAAAGGSVTALCNVFDSSGTLIDPPPAVVLTTDSTTATLAGNVFSFPDAGSYNIQCAVSGTTITSSQQVLVMDDAIDPLFSSFNHDLDTLHSLQVDVVTADAADDLVGLQAAKDALGIQLSGLNLSGLAAAPPLPADADLPTPAELLAAGDTPNAAIDDAFKATVLSIEQNLQQVDSLLATVTPSTITQGDVDTLNNLTLALDSLANALIASADPSHTAILAVNDQLNNIVSNLLPAQAARMSQFTVDAVSLVPGIAQLHWQRDQRLPAQAYADLMFDPRTPGDFYSQSRKAFLLLPLPGLVTVERVRLEVFKKVYLPLMAQIIRDVDFLRNANLLPTGLNPPVLDIVAGPSLGNVLPGYNLQIWGDGFAPTLSDNQIQIETPLGQFNVPVTSLVVDGSLGAYRLEGFPIPSGLCTCQFGIPEPGVVRVITPGGTSNGITINVFP